MKKGVSKVTALVCCAAMLSGAAVPAATASVPIPAAALSAANQSQGWYESACITWAPVSGASGYNVYADGNQIDSTLIRQYNGYYRADAVGLRAGSHTLKAVPVINGKEDASKAFEQTVTVKAFDRSGFGWVKGTSSGAYNEDGTLRSGAVVLYVTEATKDSVSCDVVTDSKGGKTKTTGIQEILNAVKKGYDTRPYCIRVIGTVTDPAGIAAMGGDLTIDGGLKYKGGMTLEGIGEDAVLKGFGVKVKNMSNLEIRNLAAMLCDSSEGDNFTLQQDNDHVWVHNCDSFYGMAGGDSDQAKGDGALDCKKSTYITFSYNHFFDNGKCNLLGLKENKTDDLYITYHHNWYDHSDSRHPRVRFYSAHVYNNFYDGNAKYGIGCTQSSSIFAESNYFRNCKYPMLTSMQGTDGLTDGTFSGEDGGVIKAYGNVMSGQKSFIPFSQNSSSYDAYVVANKTDKVPSSVIAKQTSLLGTGYSHTYNNFDTSSEMYSYKADDAKDVPSIVEAGAGRMNGGDFRWTFDDAKDDADYAVNTALMSALKNYRSPVVAIGSGSYVTPAEPVTSETQPTVTVTTASSSQSTHYTSSGPSGIPMEGVYLHNYTTQGKESPFYAISGNLSTAKGTAAYGALQLTQCLKMETATSVEFTAPQSGSIVLVFGEPDATVKFDDVKYVSDGSGVIEIPLGAGTHRITKADSCNLFLMDLKLGEESGSSTSSQTTTTTTTTTVMSESETTMPAENGLRGDADENGRVDVRDAVLLARIAAEDETAAIGTLGKRNSDLNNNGSLETEDLTTLLKYLAHSIASLG